MTLKYVISGIKNQSTIDLISLMSPFKEYDFVGQSESHENLIDNILAHSPELIFLNVDDFTPNIYKDISSMLKDLYRFFPHKAILVALASSEEQAYNCIKHNFFYYLDSPITRHELVKLDKKLCSTHIFKSSIPEKLCLQTYSDYRFVELKEILFLKADNNTTEFFLADNSRIVAFKTLKYFESILPQYFRRIHQSFIVNKNYVYRINLGKLECHLKPIKKRLPFSKSHKPMMKELVTKLSLHSLG